jgi:hypothetical protein
VATLEDLKAFNVDAATVSLWVFKGPRGPSGSPPTFTGHWVETTEDVDTALRDIVKNNRAPLEEVIEYGLLTQNNEGSALLIAKEETNADILIDEVAAETPNKRAVSAAHLQNSKFYLIKMVHNDTLLYAVRRTKGGWNTKRAMTARSIFFMENRLDLDNRPHFELETTIDFFVVGEDLLILDKKNFESTLRYKETHQNDFLALQAERDFAGVFADLAPLVQHVGTNKIQLRRMSAVRHKGHYRNAEFMNRLRRRHAEYGLSFEFDAEGKIIATPEAGAQIITALLDHRLFSEFSRQIYDVPDAKLVPR